MENILSNKYELIDDIGTGSFGQVYLALNKNTKSYVAIKIEDKEARGSQEQHEIDHSGLAGGNAEHPSFAVREVCRGGAVRPRTVLIRTPIPRIRPSTGASGPRAMAKKRPENREFRPSATAVDVDDSAG